MSPFEKPEARWLRLPKVGESYDFGQHGAITEIKKVDNPEHKLSRFNFKEKKTETLFDAQGNPQEISSEVDLGYFYLITFEDGKQLAMSDWSSYFAFTKAEVKEGDKVLVSHPAKGEWQITKI